jgi:hypothetical protein
MRYADALAAFRQYLEAGGLTAADLDAPSAVAAMLGFYADERASDVDMDADADMILFQWGTFDWGSGPAFEYGIIRQLCIEIDYALTNSDFDDDEKLDRRAPGHRLLRQPPSAPDCTRMGPGITPAGLTISGQNHPVSHILPIPAGSLA